VKLHEIAEKVGFIDKVTQLTAAKMKTDMPEMYVSVMPINDVGRDLFDIPDSVNNWIVLTVKEPTTTQKEEEALRTEILQQVQHRFPIGNLMGIEPTILWAEQGAQIYLTRKTNEEIKPLVRKAAEKVLTIVKKLGQLFKEENGYAVVRREDLDFYTKEGAGTVMIMFDSNVTDSIKEAFVEALHDELEMAGVLDGILPVTVKLRASMSEPDAYIVNVTPSGPAAR
jgi:hypothetical protein